mgnify:CR=1 FL=1
MCEREFRRYSEAFKLEVVREIESGHFESFEQLREKYGILGSNTISKWLVKYGREHLLPRRVRIEMPEEVDQIRKLKKRIKDLERALVNAQVAKVIDEAYFELVCEQSGITDIEGYKKKIAKMLSERDG